jgi:hypothetical protein
MSAQHHIPEGFVSSAIHSQNEVRKAIEVLLVLAETTGIELWPDNVQACYHRAMDELAALETSFYLYNTSLPQGGHTFSDGDGDGSSTSS